MRDVSPHTAARQPVALVAVRVVGLALAAASVAGLAFVAVPPSQAGAAAGDSSLTVRWTDDDGAASGYQPERVESSPHFPEFANLEVTVSQTQDLGDQAIRVSITGMAATREDDDDTGQPWSTAMNFMQAMQCWGDPGAAGFRETCQWGGRYAQNNGLGFTVYSDNWLRVAKLDVRSTATNPVDVPFRTFGGTEITGREVGDGEYPLLDYFGPSTTNEIQGARIGAGAVSSFDFETQSADQAPQLGCGRESHLRCWLVLVPRGTKYGGQDAHCSFIADDSGVPYSYGRANSIQGGSPLNPACDYWDNRMVVPLDFVPTGNNCPAGAAERSVIGSQLLVGAMVSWQPYLCANTDATYNFSTTPDPIARLQLLEGQSGLAFGSYPVVKSELDDEVAEAIFDDTRLSYAPVAIGATVIAFFAEGSSGRIEHLNISARIMAKLLTQSYVFTVPRNSAEPQKNIAHLPEVNRRYEYLRDDPDFRALNPDNWQSFNTNPAIVLPGPSSADAIRQLWRWILADDEARTWLSGETDGTFADGTGMTINPYYLPEGHLDAKVPVFSDGGVAVLDSNGAQVYREVGLSNIDGTPMEITEQTLDRFLKVDESEVPLKLTLTNQTRFGTLQAFPYVESFLAGARDAFRADTHARVVWDPARKNAAGQDGDWVSAGPQIPGQRFMIAVTDLASAERYALSTAGLRLANSTEFGHADEAGMAAALDALEVTDVAAVQQVDPASVAAGYPLTMMVYATVNLTSTDGAARRDYAAFIREVTTRGQQPGSGVGDLPVGYLPLTSELAGRAGVAATAIESFVTPTPTPTPTPSNGIAQDDYYPDPVDDGADGSEDGDGVAPDISSLGPEDESRTPAASITPIGQGGLVVALGVGLSGALFAPLLFRGRGL